MREIIDGTLYDTDNATEIDTWHNGKPKGDFKRIERTLYHTENGSWFEVVNGGAMTKFSKSVPTGGKAGDTVLRPLTEDRAFQWMEKFSDVATAFEYFEDRIDVA